MIRMSKLADYAFILLTHMMSRPAASWAAGEVAAATTLPLPTVAKVLKLLAKAGIVAAQRGAGGGYRLVQDVGQVTVAAVVEAVDGPIRLTACASAGADTKKCAVRRLCPLFGGWERLNSEVHAVLAATTLDRLLATESEA
jgi:FeS assembly SUF system regulator